MRLPPRADPNEWMPGYGTPKTQPRASLECDEGVPLNVIQRQLGHTNLGVTSIYLQGVDNAEIIATVHARRAPRFPPARASA
jgi:hypothetical protein